MPPELLSPALHDQLAAVGQGEAQGLDGFVVAMPHFKYSRGTQADGGNDGLRPQLFLIVTVPTDTVSAIAVIVGECRVELLPGNRFGTISYPQ